MQAEASLRASAIVAAVLVAGGGCQTPMSVLNAPTRGVADYTYSAGKGTRGFDAPPTDVQEAVIESMAELRYNPQLRQTNEGGVVVISGVTADRHQTEVSIASQPNFSLVTARVGTFGDRVQTRALFDRIALRLNHTETSRALTPKSEVDSEESADDRLGALDREERGAPSEPQATDMDSRASRPWIARDAVDDETMLKGQFDQGYRDSPVP